MSDLEYLAQAVTGVRPSGRPVVSITDNGRYKADSEYSLIIEWHSDDDDEDDDEVKLITVSPEEWCIALKKSVELVLR